MARLKGSTDSKPRKRRTKTPAEKKKDGEAKSRKKARDEASQRERNSVHFRTAKPPAKTCTVPAQSTRQVLEHDVLDFSETDDLKHDEGKYDEEFDDPDKAQDSELRKSLSSLAIDLVGLAGLVGDQAEEGCLAFPCEHLDDPPKKIINTFSACLGDIFHAMDQPKVSSVSH